MKSCAFNTDSFSGRFCTWEDFCNHINANNMYQNWNNNEKLLRTVHFRFTESKSVSLKADLDYQIVLHSQ